MSVYPPPSQRRQPSNVSSIASTYVPNYFPESRSITVTSASSLSSRFANTSDSTAKSTHTTSTSADLLSASSGGMSRAASFNNALDAPPPLRPSAPRAASTSYRHSYHEGSSSNHFKFPPPPSSSQNSPSFSTSPVKSTPGSPIKRIQGRDINRRSIHFADTSIPDDLSAMRYSSVSHLRTLSQISNGAAGEFNDTVSQEVAGLHGRRRLHRANTESLSSWDRLNWMDKRRQYIQAYEYLCHIGEAKE